MQFVAFVLPLWDRIQTIIPATNSSYKYIPTRWPVHFRSRIKIESVKHNIYIYMYIHIYLYINHGRFLVVYYPLSPFLSLSNSRFAKKNSRTISTGNASAEPRQRRLIRYCVFPGPTAVYAGSSGARQTVGRRGEGGRSGVWPACVTPSMSRMLALEWRSVLLLLRSYGDEKGIIQSSRMQWAIKGGKALTNKTYTSHREIASLV